jgi:hypothetical protein
MTPPEAHIDRNFMTSNGTSEDPLSGGGSPDTPDDNSQITADLDDEDTDTLGRGVVVAYNMLAEDLVINSNMKNVLLNRPHMKGYAVTLRDCNLQVMMKDTRVLVSCEEHIKLIRAAILFLMSKDFSTENCMAKAVDVVLGKSEYFTRNVPMIKPTLMNALMMNKDMKRYFAKSVCNARTRFKQFFETMGLQQWYTESMSEAVKAFVNEYLWINGEINTTCSIRRYQLDCADSDEGSGEFTHIQTVVEAIGLLLGYYTLDDMLVRLIKNYDCLHSL